MLLTVIRVRQGEPVKYKLLALDLDGTTLTSQHEILPQVNKEIQRIKDDVVVLLVTGRHHTAAKPYHHELGLDTPIISCNGTYIYDFNNESIVKENALPKDKAKQFLQLARQYRLNMVMYVTDAMTFSSENPIEYMKALEAWAEDFPAAIKPEIRRIASFEHELEQNDYIWKFVVEGDIEQIESFTQLPFIQDEFSGEKSWSNRIDFANKGNTKGARLAEYIQTIGIKPSEVIAIGDNHNDISMIELAGLGVAMANADDVVKCAADILTPEGNDGQGIADIISTYFSA